MEGNFKSVNLYGNILYSFITFEATSPRWWEGPVSALKGADMSEKSARLSQKGAFAGRRGAVCAWKSAVMGERNVFVSEARLCRRKGRGICLG